MFNCDLIRYGSYYLHTTNTWTGFWEKFFIAWTHGKLYNFTVRVTPTFDKERKIKFHFKIIVVSQVFYDLKKISISHELDHFNLLSQSMH